MTFDSETAEFQVDTGSSYTSVASTDVTRKYKVTGSKERTSASGNIKKDEQITLASIKIGTKEKKNFQVVRYSQHANQMDRVGMDVLAHFNLNFDLKKNILRFDQEIPEELARQPLQTYPGKTFGFLVEMDGQHIQSLWDTGAELSVIDRKFVSEHPAKFKFIQKIENGVDATGNSVDFDLYLVSDLKIGTKVISGKVMSMDFKMIREKINSDIKLIIGTNLMVEHNWYFDLGKGVWGFE